MRMVDFHTHQGLIYCSLIDFVHFSLLVAAVSVSVSGWTLVAISVERFYAICHPLVSKAYSSTTRTHRERERLCLQHNTRILLKKNNKGQPKMLLRVE
jgi:hypothetical protein